MKKRTKKYSLFLNIGISIASLLLFLFIMEIVLGFYGFGELCIYEPDRKLFWKPLPDQTCYTKVDHMPVQINAQGTRGKDFSETKPDKTFRILSLGDSRTFGWGLSESETYSALLEKLLQDKAGEGLTIEVINAGVNGWSYAQIYQYLKSAGLKYDPDLVILANANEWTQFSDQSSEEFVDAFMTRVRLKNLLRRSALYHFIIEVKLRRYYEKYRTLFIPVDPKQDSFFKDEQDPDPWRFFREQAAIICDLLNEDQTKGLILYIPREQEKENERFIAYQIVSDVSREFQIPLLDMTNDFSHCREMNDTCHMPADSIHPNAEGNRIIAHRLVSIIEIRRSL